MYLSSSDMEHFIIREVINGICDLVERGVSFNYFIGFLLESELNVNIVSRCVVPRWTRDGGCLVNLAYEALLDFVHFITEQLVLAGIARDDESHVRFRRGDDRPTLEPHLEHLSNTDVNDNQGQIVRVLAEAMNTPPPATHPLNNAPQVRNDET